MGMVKEFKDFAMKGNVVDMAVGVVIGAAFGKIIASLVNDVMLPPIGYLMKGIDFKSMFVSLDGKEYENLEAAKKVTAPVIGYGSTLTEVVGFLITAFCIFLVVKGMNSMKKKADAAPAEPALPPKQEVLLQEIRDLLAKK